MTIDVESVVRPRQDTRVQVPEAAVLYARLGWPVLPLHTPLASGCSCGRDCGSAGKHPRTRHGVHDASCDPEVVRSWWRRFPDANVGIATGPASASGLVVLDFDTSHGGLQNLEWLQRRFGKLPETLMAASGGGGLHLYFQWPGGVTEIRNVVGLAQRQGVDVRAAGGFIVAPPSRHRSGSRYTWLTWDTRPAPLPERWVRLLAARQQPRQRRFTTHELDPALRSERALAAAIRQARPGLRNRLGYWLACRLIEAGVSEGEAHGIMRHYAEAVGHLGEHPYTVEEALASYRSACRPAAHA